MQITTKERLKQLLGGFTGTSLDLVLNQIIAGVSMQIENSPLFDRYIKCEARSEIFDTDNSQQIFSLKGYPVAAAPAAQIWFDTSRAFTNTAMATNLYAIDSARGKVKIDGYGMIKAKQCLKITYTGGLAVATFRMLGTVNTITGTFVAGQTVTGQTNGATGTVVAVSAGNMSIDVIDGKFEVGEVINNADTPTPASTTILTITQRPLIMDYADLVLAADMQSAFVFQRRNSLGIRSISMEGGSIQTFEKVDLIPAVRGIIRQYRRI